MGEPCKKIVMTMNVVNKEKLETISIHKQERDTFQHLVTREEEGSCTWLNLEQGCSSCS